MKNKIRYKRRRSARVYHWNPWNPDIEIGDLLVDHRGKLYRAEASTGWGKRKAGDLTPREIKPPDDTMKAIIVGDEVFWVAK